MSPHAVEARAARSAEPDVNVPCGGGYSALGALERRGRDCELLNGERERVAVGAERCSKTQVR